MIDANKERLYELLAERATSGLDAPEALELESLLDAHPEWDNDSFDLAAAALDLALSGPTEPLPAHLRARLLASAEALASNRSSSHGAADPATGVSSPSSSRPGQAAEAEVIEIRPRARSTPWGGWMAAAAALAVLGLAYFWLPGGAGTRPSGSALAPVPVTPAMARQELLATAADAVELPWTVTEDPAAVSASGDVVWSGAEQAGFMTIRGLAANDPTQYQYQLWVFDARRDERYPVDGGVFDVASGSDEVVVPIDVRVPVSEAALFAVTVEPPGGVVVSNRERIVLVARPVTG